MQLRDKLQKEYWELQTEYSKLEVPCSDAFLAGFDKACELAKATLQYPAWLMRKEIMKLGEEEVEE